MQNYPDLHSSYPSMIGYSEVNLDLYGNPAQHGIVSELGEHGFVVDYW